MVKRCTKVSVDDPKFCHWVNLSALTCSTKHRGTRWPSPECSAPSDSSPMHSGVSCNCVICNKITLNNPRSLCTYPLDGNDRPALLAFRSLVARRQARGSLSAAGGGGAALLPLTLLLFGSNTRESSFPVSITQYTGDSGTHVYIQQTNAASLESDH